MIKPVTLLSCLLPLILIGCAQPAASSPQPTPVVRNAMGLSCPRPRRIVVALDRSGSYASAGAAREQLAVFVERFTCPADELLVRWLAADSYGPEAAIFQASLPGLAPQPPPPANPFTRRQHERELAVWSAQAAQLTAAQQAVAQAIRDLEPEEAPETDVVGVFVKAGELLANTPAGQGRLIVAATDLEDTVDRRAPFDLAGVTVLVLAFETDDPIRAAATREAWGRRLAEAGASQVIFRDPSESLTGLSELAAAPEPRGPTQRRGQ